MKYEIVESRSRGVLEDMVNEKLKEGWKLAGSAFSSTQTMFMGFGYERPSIVSTFHQPMTKDEE